MTERSDHPDRDPLLERAWRVHSDEQPSASLDRTILDAAHRAVRRSPRDASRGPALAARSARWWPLAAAASLAVVVVGIVRQAPQDVISTTPTGQGDAAEATVPTAQGHAPDATMPPARRDAPEATMPRVLRDPGEPKVPSAQRQEVPAPAAVVPQTTVPRPSPAPHRSTRAGPAEPSTRAAPRATVPSAAERPRAEETDVAAPVRSAREARERTTSPPRAPPSGEREAGIGIDSGGAMPQQTPAASAPAPTPFPAGRGGLAAGAQSATEHPDAWIARIRALRDEGRLDDVARELAEFRAAFADADRRLPPDLREPPRR